MLVNVKFCSIFNNILVGDEMIQERHLEKRVHVYEIETRLLPLATKLMNQERCGNPSPPFESRVIEIITGEPDSMIIVEVYGKYPYITTRWEKELGVKEE